jgi:hypothetical protein
VSPRLSLDRLVDRTRALSARDRRALVIGAVVLVPALLWTAVMRPYVRTLGDYRDRLAAERALLEREKAVLEEVPMLPARLEEARSALARWNAGFVQSANPALAEAEVTSLMETIARESRVLLQEVGAMTLPPEVIAPEGLLPFRLSVRGESDFEGVLRFLHGMEQDPLLLKVVGLSMEPVPFTPGGGRGGGQPSQPGAMSFVVIVEAYVPGEAETSEAGT